MVYGGICVFSLRIAKNYHMRYNLASTIPIWAKKTVTIFEMAEGNMF